MKQHVLSHCFVAPLLAIIISYCLNKKGQFVGILKLTGEPHVSRVALGASRHPSGFSALISSLPPGFLVPAYHFSQKWLQCIGLLSTFSELSDSLLTRLLCIFFAAGRTAFLLHTAFNLTNATWHKCPCSLFSLLFS